MEFGTHVPAGPTAKQYPMLRIDPVHGTLYRDDTEHQFGREVTVIGLGLLRSRVLWPEEMGGRPTCRSADSITGQPQRGFPWKNVLGPGEKPTMERTCADCALRAKGPRGLSCKQNWIIPCRITFGRNETIPAGWDDPIFRLTVDYYSAIDALEKYLIPFRDTATPLYSTTTRIMIRKVGSNGKARALPVFSKGSPTAESRWPEFAAQLDAIREHVRVKPRVSGAGSRFQGLQLG
ncbi:hypothetical protein SEA_REYNAULD_58 [Rhodococcus phage Reynauld]|uniref:Uncharacterized protein n=1 Tax=Rhodococcus phage Reynauld TaxID=3062845 RepID=A0ACD4UJN9_9CAUD|nr:hypothetical protein SEA_REYNAULD_58 [Rhodococcus phage Reynauld]